MTPKKFLERYSMWVLKNSEFYAVFKFVEEFFYSKLGTNLYANLSFSVFLHIFKKNFCL
jgi:hypothetical protein